MAQECRCIIIGSAEIGKTSIIKRFADDTFSDKKLPDNIESLTKVKELDGQQVTYKLVDTQGGEKFRTLTSSFYKRVEAIVIAYSVDDLESFNEIEVNKQEADFYAQSAVKVLCANKVDLVDRKITQAQGKEVAMKMKLPYFETSAKTGDGIAALFSAVGRDVLSLKEGDDPKPRITGIVKPPEPVTEKKNGHGCILI